MPLRDLLVTEKAVTEELLESILSGYVKLAEDTRRAVLTPEGAKLPARARILLVLAARHAWRFVEPGAEQDLSLPLSEISEQTGLSGNTVRPTLKELKDKRIVESPRAGAYGLPPHSLSSVASELEAIKKR